MADHKHVEVTRWNEVRQCFEHGCTVCGEIRRVPVELTGLEMAKRRLLQDQLDRAARAAGRS